MRSSASIADIHRPNDDDRFAPIAAQNALMISEKLETECLSRDVAQGVADAKWAAILRDKFDVHVLIEHISEAARSKD